MAKQNKERVSKSKALLQRKGLRFEHKRLSGFWFFGCKRIKGPIVFDNETENMRNKMEIKLSAKSNETLTHGAKYFHIGTRKLVLNDNLLPTVSLRLLLDSGGNFFKDGLPEFPLEEKKQKPPFRLQTIILPNDFNRKQWKQIVNFSNQIEKAKKQQFKFRWSYSTKHYLWPNPWNSTWKKAYMMSHRHFPCPWLLGDDELMLLLLAVYDVRSRMNQRKKRLSKIMGSPSIARNQKTLI